MTKLQSVIDSINESQQFVLADYPLEKVCQSSIGSIALTISN